MKASSQPIQVARNEEVGPEHMVNSFTLSSSSESDNDGCKEPTGSPAEDSPSIYAQIDADPPIEAFYKDALYRQDTSPTKVNLSIGAYRTDEGRPWVLPVVEKAMKHVADTPDFEYLNVMGNEAFTKVATELLLGERSCAIAEGRTIGVQCLSGTGCLRIGACVLRSVLGYDTVYISRPSWINHRHVFESAGFPTIREYRYLDWGKCQLNIDGMLDDLAHAEPGKTVVVLHACAHNPTGVDPTHEQWREIAKVIKAKQLFPFFDIAYQGFATGDPDADAWAIRHFVDEVGLEVMVAQSFSKNMGLYNERIGNLTITIKSPKYLPALRSKIARAIYSTWSNPPARGARIVHRVLTSPELKLEWLENLKTMSSRVQSMRTALCSQLDQLKTPGDWSHIARQTGMFSYTGLNEAQVDYLANKHRVYMLKNGRMNVCGLNEANVKYVAEAINDSVRNCPYI